MSRIAKVPIKIISSIDVKIHGQDILIRGEKGTLRWDIHPKVQVIQKNKNIFVKPYVNTKKAWALAGTTRALINNMIIGCKIGFSKKLILVGVGYRAQVDNGILYLNLGFSHPINYSIPQGITIKTLSQTEILISGSNKQCVGQVAAEVRAYRPPEPYKGKGIRYANESIIRKEAKKK